MRKTFNILVKIISIILFLCSIIFDFDLVWSNILPLKYSILIIIVSNLVLFLFSMLLCAYKIRVWLKTTITVISSIIILFFILFSVYLTQTVDLLKINSFFALPLLYHFACLSFSICDLNPVANYIFINAFRQLIYPYKSLTN